MSDNRIELVLNSGVLTFDERVLERFGFGYAESTRVHAAEIDEIILVRKRLVGTLFEVKARGASGMMISPEVDDAEYARLEAFVAEVRSTLGGDR